MKKVRLYESFHNLEEAKRGTIHKAVKTGDYPATIVVIENGKVVHQETVNTPEAVPASFNVLQKEYPKAKLHVEDKGGKTLFVEGLEVTEAKAFDKLNKMASKRFGEHGVATLSQDEMAELIDVAAADKMAEKMFGEFGFATLSEDEMEKLINKNPKLVKESNITEANADGTISDDEDERRAALVKRVKEQMEEILASAELDANDIGGKFRAPGIIAEVRKEIERQVKKFR